MKNIVIALLFSVSIAGFVGCKSTPQQIAYNTASGTSITVETALAAYDQFAKAGKTSVVQNQQVAAAYAKYQAAMALVCDAGAVYSATSETNAAPASAALQQATSNATQTITDLVNLIRSFGVNI
jgi:hypothetical protein